MWGCPLGGKLSQQYYAQNWGICKIRAPVSNSDLKMYFDLYEVKILQVHLIFNSVKTGKHLGSLDSLASS